jgi:uncharacterized cupin superfamily protein
VADVPEAKLIETDGGLEPEGPGWFVVNAADATWWNGPFGSWSVFEGERGSPAEFAEYGINIHVLEPGKPNSMYHGEDAQEDFLVLTGECILLVEGQERRLKAWDFVHFPPWTEHVLVGVGDEPCAVLMVGSRREGDGVLYPASELARSFGAGVEVETRDGKVAYASYPDSVRARPAPRGLPWERS